MLPDPVRLVRRAIAAAEARGLTPADAATAVSAAFVAATATYNGKRPAAPVPPGELGRWLDDLANTASTAARSRRPA